jgi:4-amino-4-deoxy-L-arabinose transferase-like glycosyltransferase
MPRRMPEVSLGLGLATATVAYTIYNRNLPPGADQRVGAPGDDHLEAARKQSAWLAAGTVAGISLLAKDPTIFVIGGLSVVVLDWLTRVNNWTNPLSGRMDLNPFTVESAGDRVVPASNDTMYQDSAVA